jgi:hypothetical protein
MNQSKLYPVANLISKIKFERTVNAPQYDGHSKNYGYWILGLAIIAAGLGLITLFYLNNFYSL